MRRAGTKAAALVAEVPFMVAISFPSSNVRGEQNAAVQLQGNCMGDILMAISPFAPPRRG